MTTNTSFSPVSPVSSIASKVKRCKVCKKKTKLNFYTCKCDEEAVFCDVHRFPFEHSCSLDKFTLHQRTLQSSMTKVLKSKMEPI